jgi:hypothetical protein
VAGASSAVTRMRSDPISIAAAGPASKLAVQPGWAGCPKFVPATAKSSPSRTYSSGVVRVCPLRGGRDPAGYDAQPAAQFRPADGQEVVTACQCNASTGRGRLTPQPGAGTQHRLGYGQAARGRTGSALRAVPRGHPAVMNSGLADGAAGAPR